MNQTKKKQGRPSLPPNPELSDFALLIRSLRELKDYSMSKAAKLADMASPQLWAAYESGRREPTIGQANRMLSVFKMGVAFKAVRTKAPRSVSPTIPGNSTKSVESTKKV